MKKIVVRAFGDPSVMKLEDAPDRQPERGQVVVALRAIGVNPVETYVRSGTYANKPKLPYTPGSDAAGVVEAVGAEVDDFAVGDRVYINASLSGTFSKMGRITRSITRRRLITTSSKGSRAIAASRSFSNSLLTAISETISACSRSMAASSWSGVAEPWN